jgi:hypothetical protein
VPVEAGGEVREEAENQQSRADPYRQRESVCREGNRLISMNSFWWRPSPVISAGTSAFDQEVLLLSGVVFDKGRGIPVAVIRAPAPQDRLVVVEVDIHDPPTRAGDLSGLLINTITIKLQKQSARLIG